MLMKGLFGKKLGEYEEEFARQVSLLKKTLHKNRYVENAKDYIYKHLHNVKNVRSI